MHCDDKDKKRMKKAEGSEVKKEKLTSAEMMQIIEKNHDKSARAVMKHLPLADGPPEGLVDFGIMMIDKYRKVQDQLERNDENDSREKKAVGSVIKKATEGADELLSAARKDVVKEREPDTGVSEAIAAMADEVSKVKGSAEETTQDMTQELMKDTTKLVNSFDFSGGNKKMDKAFIMESLSSVGDSGGITTKESVAEFITDLHRTQMDEESKPLLSPKDFKKLETFASEEERVGKAEGGMYDDDVEKYIEFNRQFEQSMDKADSPEAEKKIMKRFQQVEDSFEPEVIFLALKKMDESNDERDKKVFGGILKKVFTATQEGSEPKGLFAKAAGIINSTASGEGFLQKIKGHGQLEEASISNLEGPDPIEPSNNSSIGYAEGGDVDEDDMPVDTYDNISEDEKEEVEKSQLPDDEMESEYADHVLEQSLSEKEQEYLLDMLEEDTQLADIFDKIMSTAGEFAGDGAVEGPGTGTSDSIPARLSDGEFVFTQKSVDVIGADELQKMMDDAEREYDEDREGKYGGGMMDSLLDNGGKDYDKEVHEQMLSANAMPSVRKR